MKQQTDAALLVRPRELDIVPSLSLLSRRDTPAAVWRRQQITAPHGPAGRRTRDTTATQRINYLIGARRAAAVAADCFL